jgi:transposase
MTTMTAAQLRTHTGGMDQAPDPEVPERPRPPRTYPAAYRLRILEEYEQLDKAGKGALLRREGLYTSLLSEWRKQRDKGALQALQQRRGRPPVDPRDRELARLERENARLRDRVARQAKVIEVQGNSPRCLAGSRRAATTRPARTRRAASRAADGRAGSGRGHAGAGGGDGAGLPGGRPAPLRLVSPSPAVPTTAALAATGTRTAAAGAVGGRTSAGPGRAARRAVLGCRARHGVGDPAG